MLKTGLVANNVVMLVDRSNKMSDGLHSVKLRETNSSHSFKRLLSKTYSVYSRCRWRAILLESSAVTTRNPVLHDYNISGVSGGATTYSGVVFQLGLDDSGADAYSSIGKLQYMFLFQKVL